MKVLAFLGVLAGIAICAISYSQADNNTPDPTLKVVLIRHGEKLEQGDNLSCKGMERALKLPKVLAEKFDLPRHTYVPTLDCGKTTSHSRMFQTVSPFAAKYNLDINTKYREDDLADVAADVRKKKGTVLMVWRHSNMKTLAARLGVSNPTNWDDADFDSIWVITFPGGQAQLTVEQQNIHPTDACSY